jgi:hypothetical protein
VNLSWSRYISLKKNLQPLFDMTEPIKVLADCITCLADLNQRIYTAQQRAVQSVNRELGLLYWHIGREIRERQQSQGWDAKVIEQLAKDLNAAFSDMKGISRRNLLYMLSFAEAWPDSELCATGCFTIALGARLCAAEQAG